MADDPLRAAFAKALTSALREAEAARAAAPPPTPAELAAEARTPQLAAERLLKPPSAQAHTALQYDFPLVSPAALSALAAALATGGAGALERFPLTAPLLSTLEAGARTRLPSSEPAEPEVAEARSSTAVAYSRLAAALFGPSLLQLVLADDARADALLARLCLPPQAPPEEAVPAAAPAEEPEAAGEDSDSDWEAELEQAARAAPPAAPTDGAAQLPMGERVDAKLRYVAARLRYELLAAPGVWAAAGLSGVLLSVLRAAAARPRASAPAVCAAVAAALQRRWAEAGPDGALAPTLALLATEGDEMAGAPTPLGMLGALAAAAEAPGAPAAAGTALWPHLHAAMVPLLVPAAEALVKTPGAVGADARCEALGAVLCCYARSAPPGTDPGELLQPCGVIRCLCALLLSAPLLPLQPARHALLLCAAASPGIAAYAAAVPELSQAMASGGASVTALWPLVMAAPNAAGKAVLPVVELLSAATEALSAGSSLDDALHTLQLLRSAMQAAGPGRLLWRRDGELAASLRTLHLALLARPGVDDGEATAAEERAKAQRKTAALLRCVKDVMSSGSERKFD